MEKLVFLGAGSHFHSVLDSFDGSYEIAGVLDDLIEPNSTVCGCPVIGDFSMIATLKEEGIHHVFISIGDLGLRKRLMIACENHGLKMISIIDKSAVISPTASLRSGTFVGKGAIINANVMVEKAAIINTGAVLEHDCVIGSNVHIAPRVTLCGNVVVSSHAFIGAGSVVIPGICIKEGAIVGANSTVLQDVDYQMKVAGCPARVI